MPKRLIYAPAVQTALRGLDPEGVRRVHAWFAYLERWDTDQVVRDNSVPLPGHEGVLVLRTTTDIRIFFRIDGDDITVLDVATTPTIYTSGGISIGGATDVRHDWMQKTN
jgi:hypothetical protein